MTMHPPRYVPRGGRDNVFYLAFSLSIIEQSLCFARLYFAGTLILIVIWTKSPLFPNDFSKMRWMGCDASE